VVPPDSRGISRVPRYSGSLESRRWSNFAYGAITRSGRLFQVVRLSASLLYLVSPLRGLARASYNPCSATAASLTRNTFRLIPVRSPLLGESRLISLPRGTKMFQFPRFPQSALCIQTAVPEHDLRPVARFGYPRLSLLTAIRGLSQPSTPFFGS
jgi:hypothetical protein